MTMPVLPPQPPRVAALVPTPPQAVPLAPGQPAAPVAAMPPAPLSPGGAGAPSLAPPNPAWVAPQHAMQQGPPAPVPGPPTPPPATVDPKGTLQDRPQAKDISNPFERIATMIVDTAQDQATRMAANLGEHPSDTAPTDPSTLHEMFQFSPYGTDAPARFWQVHDELLQTAMHANDPDPYAVAERGALDEVYPYRAQMALLDTLGPEQRVTRAEQLLDVSHRQIAAGNPHDALPSIVGPSGRPGPGQNVGGAPNG